MRYSVFAVNPQNFISFGSFVPSGKFLPLFLDNLKSKVESSCLMILKASYHVKKQKTLTQRLIIGEQNILRGQRENVMSTKMRVNLMKVVSSYFLSYHNFLNPWLIFMNFFFVFARLACTQYTLKEKATDWDLSILFAQTIEQIVLKVIILFRLS